MAETLPDIHLDETLEKIRDHVREGLEKKLTGTKLTESTAEIVLKEYRRLLAEAIEKFVEGEAQGKSYEKFGDYLKGLRCCENHRVLWVDRGNGLFLACVNCDELWIPAEEITRGMKEAAEIIKRHHSCKLNCELHKGMVWLEKYGKDFEEGP